MNDQKILDNVPPKQGKWPDCNQVDSDGKWSHRQPLIRSLADIKELVELRNSKVELEKERDLMLHEVAKQYDGNDLTEWSIGANHVFKLFTKWVFNKRSVALKVGE